MAFIPWNPIIASRLNSDEKIKQMAEKYAVTESQLILKWLFNHSENIHFSREDFNSINQAALEALSAGKIKNQLPS